MSNSFNLSDISTFNTSTPLEDSNTTTANSASPQLSLVLANSVWIRTLIIVQMFLAIAAIFANILILVIIRRVEIFHVNLRLLLANLSAILIWLSFGSIVKSCIFFADMDRRTSTSSMSSYECKRREMFVVAIANNAINYASMSLCLERVYSTIRYKTYDKTGAKPWLGSILLICCWSIVITIQSTNLAGASRTDKIVVCENLLSITSRASAASLSSALITESLVIVLSVFVTYFNKKQLRRAIGHERSNENLRSRFQLDQNVRINRMITPAMIFEAICFAPNYLFLISVLIGLRLETDLKATLIHVSYTYKLLFAFVNPLLIIFRNPVMVNRLRKMTPTRLRGILFGKREASETKFDEHAFGDRATETHFNTLGKLWATSSINAATMHGSVWTR